MMKNRLCHTNRTIRCRAVLLLLLAILLVAVGHQTAFAKTDGGYTLTWWTIDTGGQLAATGSGGYTMHSTAGQPDANLVVSTNGTHTLQSGFWPSAKAMFQYFLFPILKNP